ncbi:MAG: hypothetical protein KDA57_07570 [Planctomycetales bacterium]|nr:hypothetical protein [Planctomycetales bacterium]
MNIQIRTLGIVLTVVGSLGLVADSAQAQYGGFTSKSFINTNSTARFSTSQLQSQVRTRSIRNDRVALPNLGSYRPRSSSKPFSSISRAPTVSPYLALNNSFDQASSYYTSVRPQQQQYQMNQQLQRQGLANQHRLNQMAARGPYSPRGDEDSAPTGHVAVFMNLGTYLNTGSYFAGPPTPR